MSQPYSKIAKHLKANPVKQKSAVKCIYSPQLTYKVYCLLEVGADVGHVAVLHRDPLVVIVALGRLQVPAWHVEQGCDVKVVEIILSGGMVGTTEVEERQDLYWFTLRKEKREKAETWVKLTTHSFDRQIYPSAMTQPLSKQEHPNTCQPIITVICRQNGRRMLEEFPGIERAHNASTRHNSVLWNLN